MLDKIIKKYNEWKQQNAKGFLFNMLHCPDTVTAEPALYQSFPQKWPEFVNWKDADGQTPLQLAEEWGPSHESLAVFFKLCADKQNQAPLQKSKPSINVILT